MVGPPPICKEARLAVSCGRQFLKECGVQPKYFTNLVDNFLALLVGPSNVVQLGAVLVLESFGVWNLLEVIERNARAVESELPPQPSVYHLAAGQVAQIPSVLVCDESVGCA